MARLARRLYAYAFLEDLILLYPVYALLFADHGLSAAEISTLFIVWSCVTFFVEIPSGLWADVFSRRRLLVLAPLVTGAGFALWTWLPSYWGFAAGFVLWGTGGSLSSGTLQALVYEELERCGASGAYARLTGRARALGTTAELAAAAAAGPVLHLGGYAAVGAASVTACVLGAAVGRSFPEHGRTSAARAAVRAGEAEPGGDDGKAGETEVAGPGGEPGEAMVVGDSGKVTVAAEPGEARVPSAEPEGGVPAEPEGGGEAGGAEEEPGLRAVLRAGAGELRASRTARGAVLLTCVVTGFLMIDEYVPLLIASMDVDAASVPPLLLLVTAGVAVGGWCAGRGERLFAPALAVGALALAAGALAGPPGAVLLAVAFGVFQWAMITCDARLQHAVTDRARATLTSVAGFGAEVVSVLLCAGYALGSQLWAHSTLFVLAAVPYLLIALVLGAGGRRVRRGGAQTGSRDHG